MFKTDHKLWRTSKGDQYRSSSETGVCWVYWAAFASQAPRGCRAQQITTASASPSWGRFFDTFDFGRSKFWSMGTTRLLLYDGRWRWCWSPWLSRLSASCSLSRYLLRRTGLVRLFQAVLVAPMTPTTFSRAKSLASCFLHAKARCSDVSSPRFSARIIHVNPHQSETISPLA